ncbi:MAG TPA: CRTAC1 family protein [Candidatus Angelobacter sp.]
MARIRTVAVWLIIAAGCSAVLWGQNRQLPRRRSSPKTVNSKPSKTGAKAAFTSVPIFEDIAARAGLTVPHISSKDKRYVIESMSGGIGLFDCDNDGKLDIVLVNGSTVDRYRQGGDPMVTLYHQEANLKFTDITEKAGLTRKGWGMGVAVADFDNDGLLDLYVTGYGGNVLYHNKGNCTFEDVTERAGVRVGGFSTGAAWADYDRDGNVDLFVSRYVHVDMEHLPEFGSTQFCRFKGIPVQCGPWGMIGESHFLFHNRGDGTFEDVSRKAGVSNPNLYYGLGAVWGDYDNDGWSDLYVANDTTPNYLYHNNHDGTFTDVGMHSGAALSGEGHAEGSMGVDFGDYDRDGLLDILVTNFAEQSTALYHNRGRGDFDDVRETASIAKETYPLVGWGVGFFDMNNDGWLDLFEVNGHVYPQMDTVKGSAPYAQPMLLYRNNRNGTFSNVSGPAGITAMPLKSRRGVAFGDIANNGNIDMVVLNVGDAPSLLLNTARNSNHRVLFKLVGVKSNRAAIGARVTVRAAGMTQFSEVRGGGGYLSQNDLRLHFGFGTAPSMDSVQVRWPNGAIEEFKNLPADKIYTLVEGQGIKNPESFSAPQ